MIACLHNGIEHGAGPWVDGMGIDVLRRVAAVLGEDRQVVSAAETLAPPGYDDHVDTGVEVGALHRVRQFYGVSTVIALP